MLRYLLSARCLILLCRWRSSLIVVLIFSLFFLMVRIEGFFFKRSPLFELDIIRAGLTLLRVWVIALSLMASLYLKNHRTQNKFLVCIRVLVIFLVATFCFNNYLIFYIGFECRVLPVLFLILGWGYQPERVQAGLYLLFYTMVVSLPFLVLIRYREVCG